MNYKERIALSELVKKHNTENTTHKIRKLKHSRKITENINVILKLKNDGLKGKKLEQKVLELNNFLFMNYTDIFDRILKDEIDLKIMSQFLSVLSRIENGELDQHEASNIIGVLLKQLYIDPVIERDNMDNYVKPLHNMSWKQFKKEKEII